MCLTKPRAGISRDYYYAIVFEKLRVKNVFPPHGNEKSAFSNSSGLKRVFEKLRFPDGLVWTVSLTAESNFSGVVWTGPKGNTIVYDSHLNTAVLLFFNAYNCYGYINVFILNYCFVIINILIRASFIKQRRFHRTMFWYFGVPWTFQNKPRFKEEASFASHLPCSLCYSCLHERKRRNFGREGRGGSFDTGYFLCWLATRAFKAFLICHTVVCYMFPGNSPGVLPLCNAECTLKPPLFSPVLCYISRALAEGSLICFLLRYTGRSLVHLPVHSPWVPLHVPCVSIYVHSCIPHRFPVDSFFFLTYEGFHSWLPCAFPYAFAKNIPRFLPKYTPLGFPCPPLLSLHNSSCIPSWESYVLSVRSLIMISSHIFPMHFFECSVGVPLLVPCVLEVRSLTEYVLHAFPVHFLCVSPLSFVYGISFLTACQKQIHFSQQTFYCI